jgi:hypothetical protein
MQFIRSFQIMFLALSMVTAVHAAADSSKPLVLADPHDKGTAVKDQPRTTLESKEASAIPTPQKQLVLYQAAFEPYQVAHKEGKFDISTTHMPELEPILHLAIRYVTPAVSSEQRARFETSCAQVRALIEGRALTLMNFHAFNFLLADIIDQSRSTTPTPPFPPEFRPLLESFEFTGIIEENAKIFSTDFTLASEDFGKSQLATQLKASKFPFLAVIYRASGRLPIKTFSDAYATPGSPIHLAALSIEPCSIHGGILAKTLTFLLHDFLHKGEFDESIKEPARFAKIQAVLSALGVGDPLTLALRFYIPHEIDLEDLAIDDDPGRLLSTVCTLTKRYIAANIDLENRFNTALQRQVELFMRQGLGEGFGVRGGTVVRSSVSPNVYQLTPAVYIPSQADPIALDVIVTVSEALSSGNHTVRLSFTEDQIKTIMAKQIDYVRSLETDIERRTKEIETQESAHKSFEETEEKLRAASRKNIEDTEGAIATQKAIIEAEENRLGDLRKSNPEEPESVYLIDTRKYLAANQSRLEFYSKSVAESTARSQEALLRNTTYLGSLTKRLHEFREIFEREQKRLAEITEKLRALQDPSAIFLIPGYTYLRRFYVEDFLKLLYYMDPSLKSTLPLDADPAAIRTAGIAIVARFETAGLGKLAAPIAAPPAS